MDTSAIPRRRAAQAGFSMVEMLMAAFILAIGVLGLSMLQSMSLKATRGSKSLTNAVQIADRIMDQIESEGRLSWLNLTATNFGPPGALPTLTFVNHGSTQYLGYNEIYSATTNLTTVAPTTAAPVGGKPTLSPTVRYVATIVEGTTTTVANGTGSTTSYQVTVEFADDVNTAGARTVRSVNISRSIIHG
jgi:prepilin-type N-terminal cleavage/methylation domain-containing protein